MAKLDYSALLERERDECRKKVEPLEKKVAELERQLLVEREDHEKIIRYVGESLRAISWAIRQMEGQPLNDKLTNVFLNLKRHTAKEIASKVFEKIGNGESDADK